MEKTKVDLSLLDGVLEEYADVKGSLITILQNTQDIYGYLPKEAIELISERTGIATSEIMGVGTFYTQFRFQPVGKYLIMLCQGTACHVNGSELILQTVKDELGIEDGETTEDGIFSLKCVACLGCCRTFSEIAAELGITESILRYKLEAMRLQGMDIDRQELERYSKMFNGAV